MKLGPTPQNSWDVTPAEVSLIRPVLLPRPASIPAKPQNIVLDVARTGLVVVDMQNDFCAKGGWFAEKGADVSAPYRIVPAVQKLLTAFRVAFAPVFWVNWGNRPDNANLPPSVLHAGKPHGTGPGYGDMLPSGSGPVLVRGSHGAAVIDDLKIEPSDIIIYKTRSTGSSTTSLTQFCVIVTSRRWRLRASTPTAACLRRSFTRAFSATIAFSSKTPARRRRQRTAPTRSLFSFVCSTDSP